ncbi:MAG TPA: DNA repair protein RadC [Anaerolineaceae bacterium]|nr:DNA repair protein RadC [Anaerolineaceae bacterium]
MVRETGSNYRITDLAEDERPRERLEHLGAGALTSAELLGILLRVGAQGENAVQVGQRLLQDLGGVVGLQRCSFGELCSQFGLGPAKAAQIKAAIELGSRLRSAENDDRPVIHSPADAAELVLYDMGGLPQENLWVLLLDTRNRVLSVEKLYVGSLNASTVLVAEVFRPAIQKNAASIIVAHNHPSGDPTPSPEDLNLTRSLVQAGKLMDIEVLDHLVIGQGKFISLKQQGQGFGKG